MRTLLGICAAALVVGLVAAGTVPAQTITPDQDALRLFPREATGLAVFDGEDFALLGDEVAVGDVAVVGLHLAAVDAAWIENLAAALAGRAAGAAHAGGGFGARAAQLEGIVCCARTERDDRDDASAHAPSKAPRPGHVRIVSHSG